MYLIASLLVNYDLLIKEKNYDYEVWIAISVDYELCNYNPSSIL